MDYKGKAKFQQQLAYDGTARAMEAKNNMLGLDKQATVGIKVRTLDNGRYTRMSPTLTVSNDFSKMQIHPGRLSSCESWGDHHTVVVGSNGKTVRHFKVLQGQHLRTHVYGQEFGNAWEWFHSIHSFVVKGEYMNQLQELIDACEDEPDELEIELYDFLRGMYGTYHVPVTFDGGPGRPFGEVTSVRLVPCYNGRMVIVLRYHGGMDI